MSLLDDLYAAVGPAQVLVGNDCAPYEVDWRKRYHGRALAVVRPGSTAEVAAVVVACRSHGASLVPQGGNTGLVGASVPDASGQQVLLSTARLNRIRGVDAANLTMVVEAGCVLQRVQEEAATQGLLFALSLAAEGSCTIGGNLATNAGGTQVLRYGNARELCLGVEAVTADGRVWDGLTGLRKDNTGYDLRDLIVGSEGTLAIITAATLRLHPRPRATMTAMATLPTLAAAVQLLRRAHEMLGPGLTGFEIMNEASLGLVRKHFAQLRQAVAAAPWTALVELSDTEGEAHAAASLEALLGDALARGLIGDAAVAASLEQANAMWHVREAIPLAQVAEGGNVKHDIALPISAIEEFVAVTDADLERAFPGIRVIDFGHLGDGNLHYNVQGPPDADGAAFVARHEAAITRLVYDAVAARGGSISAEHGIGALKRDELGLRKSPVALDMMRAIKVALDPAGVLNPGRVLPPPAPR
ncbi:MAG TPA: FAD-binding oxidoreductase [Caldimonas sp.]|nr:FAD-binding oxidoreductase [Caldimonas sp.]HEX4233889.1 FAD-binding oxidoreductase [Caldimonas sp.]